MHLAAGTNVDRYVVDGLLGRGGMAVVYRVRHRTLGSVHALKVLLTQTPSVQARLLQEGRAQSGFRHGNVVSVTDVVEIGGCPALVLEYVDGPGLDRFLANARPTPEQADLIARGVLRGLAAAHKHGLVHRDLKPGNVLLALQSDEIVPKVNDFGLAKVLGASEGGQDTRTGATLGTPAYMAPEQIRDAAHVDARADVWAAGVLLYELVTGRRAFEGPDTLSVMNAVASGTFTPVAALSPTVPERMQRAIAAAMVVDPAARIATVDALLHLWQGDASPPSAEVWDAATRSRAESLRSAPSDRASSARGPLPSSAETWGAPATNATSPAPESLALPTPLPTGASGVGPAPSSPSTSRPGRARSWPRLAAAFALGTFVGVPFLFGDLGWLFDDPLGAVRDGGTFMLLTLGLCALGIGGVAAVAVDEREGRPHALPWLFVPGLITATGSLGAMFNVFLAQSRLPVAETAERATMAARGLAEAMTVTVAASTFASSLFGLAAVSLAWAVRFDHDVVQFRAVAIAILGVLLGVVAWFAHPLLSGVPGLTVTEVFPVFAMMAIALAGVLSLAEDEPRPETLRARTLATALGAFSVAHTARAVDMRHLMRAAYTFADGAREPGDLTVGEGFVASIGHIASAPGLFWAAMFLVASFPVFAWRRTGAEVPWRVLVATFGVLLAIAPVKLLADHTTGELANQVLPGEVRAVSRWHLGVELADAEGAAGGGAGGIVVVDAPEGHALRRGDRLLSVDQRAFSRTSELLHALWDCRCAGSSAPPGGSACALGRACLADGAALAMSVARPSPTGPATTLEITVPWTGTAAPTEAGAP